MVASLLSTSWASAQMAEDAGPVESQADYYLPLWGPKLAARGIRFPLPWGVGVNYTRIHQNIDISDVSIATGSSDFVNLDKLVEFDHVTSTINALNARLDVWVLPFLNVYGLANYIVQANTDVLLAEPFPLQAGAQQAGYGGGFGVTAAYGHAGTFVTLDLNFTWNQMEKLNAPVRTFLITPRVGHNFGELGPFNLVVWVGAMRQDIQSDTQGSIALSDTIGEPSDEFVDKVDNWYDGLSRPQQIVVSKLVDDLTDGSDPTIRYRLNKSIADPWNMLIGTELGLSRRVQLRAEVGFIGRTQILLGFNYRFGLVHRKKSGASPAAAR